MAVARGHAVAGRADGDGRWLDRASLLRQRTQYLERLGGQLLLLPADMGDDVIEAIQRRHAGITCPREGLHGGNEYAPQAKGIVEWLERERQPHGRAVGVGDDEPPVPPPSLALDGDQAQMIGVDLGDQQRDIGIHPVGAGVAKDGISCRGHALLDGARRPRGQRREDEFAVQIRLTRLHH